MILVDSSIWIDFFNGTATQEADFLDDALGTQSVVVGDITLAEVLQGFRSDKDFTTAKTALSEFEQFDLLGTGNTIKAAEKFRKLRNSGITFRKTNVEQQNAKRIPGKVSSTNTQPKNRI